MSDTGVDDRAVEPIRERVKKHWWRVASIAVTLVMAACSWHDPLVAVFAVIPVLSWCGCRDLARSDRAGKVVGLILLALTAWILLPRGLGLSGQWVPSVFDVCVFLPILTTVICATGLRAERSRGCLPVVGFSAFVVAGLLVAFYTLMFYAEGDTGDEGVWPGPSALQVVAGDKQCGSGGCARQLEATGDRAPELMRSYLASRGFTTAGSENMWICRDTGLVLSYRVCAKVEDVSPTVVRVTWSI
jgi:hypothetical protein